MQNIWRPKKNKRIYIVSGHYGSGKTEFSINLSLKILEERELTALVDLDIANVYFRSRERQKFLESKGIRVYSNAFGYDITADLPSIAASIRAPLEDQRYSAVIDLGGGTSGVRILNQFRSLLDPDDTYLLHIVNANRPDTNTIGKIADYSYQIMDEIGIPVGLIVNNTHMLRETRPSDIIKGYESCLVNSLALGLSEPVNCVERRLMPELEAHFLKFNDFKIFPVELYMRPTWLDR